MGPTLDEPRDPDMRFFRPGTIDEAVGLLGKADGYVCLAGGGLVVPSLRSGARPAGLVSLRGVGELHGISRREDGAVRIGAMTPHADVARSDLLSGGLALVRRAAGEIAHPVIRNMATIGGTLCRADPSADYGAALLAAGATVHLRAKGGERSVAIDDFVVGDNKTVRRPDELVVAVSLPGDTGGGSSTYVRFSRVDGDYPVVAVAVRLGWRGGAVSSARIAVGGCGPKAFRPAEAKSLVCGAARVEDIPAAVFDSAVAAARPVGDIKGSADYRRRLISGLLRRALAQAFAAVTS